jgi:ABC-type lipoprotein export system ATPase subunit
MWIVVPGCPDVQVLFDITLAFAERSFNSIVGESGSGKSTLMNIIGTLDVPTSGDVEIAGQSVASLSRNRLAELRNRTIGFVFQFHYLLPEFTALENVLMPYSIAPRSEREVLHGLTIVRFHGRVPCEEQPGWQDVWRAAAAGGHHPLAHQ